MYLFWINQFDVFFLQVSIIWFEKKISLNFNWNLWFYSGGLGQLGIECAKLLRSKYGSESVILSDIIKPNRTLVQGGPYIFADILDFKVSKSFYRRNQFCFRFFSYFEKFIRIILFNAMHCLLSMMINSCLAFLRH